MISYSPDVAFLRLYRVLEILFASFFRDDISNARLVEVLRKIQYFQSISELDALRNIVNRSKVSFTRFTQDDFRELFGKHLPQGSYTKVKNWLESGTYLPPDDIKSLIIYYVRCSLVHSKLGEKEPFLIGPFSASQEEALAHLVEDTRSLVRSLIF